MRTKNKKAFTVVELVIVIAVIAVLAATVIVIFTNVTKKAETSVDSQNVVNMNKMLASEEILSGKPETYAEAKAILQNNGYSVPMDAKSTDCIYIWDAEFNRVFIYNLETSEAEFPEDIAEALKYEEIEPSGTERWYSLNKSFNKENWSDEEIASGSVYDRTVLVKVTDETLEEYTVKPGTTEICADAFRGCRLLKKVNIADSVRIISERAFYYCYSLKEVVFGAKSSLVEVRESAFEGCGGLEKIALPDSLQTLGRKVFANCLQLNEVKFGEQSNLTALGEWIFNGCKSLVSVEVPSKVTRLSEYVFYGCENLYKITNHSNLILEVGKYRNNQPKIVVNKTDVVCLPGFFEENDFVFEEKEDGSLLMRAYLGHAELVELPETCNGKAYKLYKMRGVREVKIPSSVQVIGSEAFSNCETLSRVIFDEDSDLHSIESSAFIGCVKLSEFTVPSLVTSIETLAFYGCKNLLTVTNASALEIVKGSEKNGFIAYYAQTVNAVFS